MTQDSGFDGGQVNSQLTGIMEKTYAGETRIEKDSVLMFAREHPDETGEPVFSKEEAVRAEWQPVICTGRLRYEHIDIIVDKDRYFGPVDRFWQVFGHEKMLHSLFDSLALSE